MKSPVLIAEVMLINGELNSEYMSLNEMISELAYKLSVMCKMNLHESVIKARDILQEIHFEIN